MSIRDVEEGSLKAGLQGDAGEHDELEIVEKPWYSKRSYQALIVLCVVGALGAGIAYYFLAPAAAVKPSLAGALKLSGDERNEALDKLIKARKEDFAAMQKCLDLVAGSGTSNSSAVPKQCTELEHSTEDKSGVIPAVADTLPNWEGHWSVPFWFAARRLQVRYWAVLAARGLVKKSDIGGENPVDRWMGVQAKEDAQSVEDRLLEHCIVAHDRFAQLSLMISSTAKDVEDMSASCDKFVLDTSEEAEKERKLKARAKKSGDFKGTEKLNFYLTSVNKLWTCVATKDNNPIVYIHKDRTTLPQPLDLSLGAPDNMAIDVNGGILSALVNMSGLIYDSAIVKAPGPCHDSASCEKLAKDSPKETIHSVNNITILLAGMGVGFQAREEKIQENHS